jgi:hypothetical protein
MHVEKTFVDLRLNLCNAKEVSKSLPEAKSFVKKPKRDCFLGVNPLRGGNVIAFWESLVHSDLWSLRG